MTPMLSGVKKTISNVFKNANDSARTYQDISSHYSPQVALGYTVTGGAGNGAQKIANVLAKRNLPGQVLAGAIAKQRANSPQYQTNLQLSRGGQTINPAQKQRTIEAGQALVMGATAPVRKTPRIDNLTQKEMVDFIDYVRLRQPKNLPTELGATRIAENYGLRMPKTTAGLANEFDRVLTVLRQRR